MNLLQRLALFSLLLLISTSAVQAQGAWRDKLTGSFGFFLEFFPITYENTQVQVFEVPQLYQGFHISGDYLLAHHNDILSVSGHAGANLAFSYSNLFGANILAQTPIFLVGRVGAGATKYNENKVGFGLGIGGNYTFLMLPYSSSNFEVEQLNASFIAPAAMVEISGDFGGSVISLRGHLNLLPSKEELEDPTSPDEIPINLSNWGIGMVYKF